MFICQTRKVTLYCKYDWLITEEMKQVSHASEKNRIIAQKKYCLLTEKKSIQNYIKKKKQKYRRSIL